MVATPNNYKYVARPRLPGVVELVFAGTWLAVIGLLNVFYAISVIAGSDIFITTASWLVGDARPWGWLMLLVGLTQLAATPVVFIAKPVGLWIGVVSVCGHIAAALMFFADSAPIAIMLLILDAAVLACLIYSIRNTE